MNTSSPISKVLCIVASSLLVVVALFHASGIGYITEIVQESDLSTFVKDIFPVLFIIPSLQLLALAAFGILATKMESQTKTILLLLSLFVLIDALLAFYLNAWIPALILVLPAIMYLLAVYYERPKTINFIQSS